MHPSRLRLGPSQSRPLTDASPGSARSPGLRVCRAAPSRRRNIHTHAPFRTECQSFLRCRDMRLTISRKQRSGHAAALAGYAGFSFRDLAAEAGIKSASVHHTFPYEGGCHSRASRGGRFLTGSCCKLAKLLTMGRGSPPSGRPRKTAPVNSMRRLPADVDGPVPEPAAVGIIDGAVMPAISRGRRGDDRPHRDACGRSRHDRGRPPSVVPDAAAPIAGTPGPAGPGPWAGAPSGPMQGTGARPPNRRPAPFIRRADIIEARPRHLRPPSWVRP